MITRVTIRCDWPGCKAELEHKCGLLHPDEPGWKTENREHFYSLHLCPAHAQKSFSKVRMASAESLEAPDTGRFSRGK